MGMFPGDPGYSEDDRRPRYERLARSGRELRIADLERLVTRLQHQMRVAAWKAGAAVEVSPVDLETAICYLKAEKMRLEREMGIGSGNIAGSAGGAVSGPGASAMVGPGASVDGDAAGDRRPGAQGSGGGGDPQPRPAPANGTVEGHGPGPGREGAPQALPPVDLTTGCAWRWVIAILIVAIANMIAVLGARHGF